MGDDFFDFNDPEIQMLILAMLVLMAIICMQ